MPLARCIVLRKTSLLFAASRSDALAPFGVTGDLAYRKLIPALYNLWLDKWLTEPFKIFCVDGKPDEQAAFLQHLRDGIDAFSRQGIERAFTRARAARAAHQVQLVDLGRTALQRVRESGQPAVVVIGRPYNTLDAAVSLDLPQFIASCGVEVVPMDCLPFEPSLLTGEFESMFWHYGQRILSALLQVARAGNLYAVYLTNFGCGPDSFVLSYAESIMGGKPMLVLELDEHAAGNALHIQGRPRILLDGNTRIDGEIDPGQRRLLGVDPDGRHMADGDAVGEDPAHVHLARVVGDRVHGSVQLRGPERAPRPGRDVPRRNMVCAGDAPGSGESSQEGAQGASGKLVPQGSRRGRHTGHE